LRNAHAVSDMGINILFWIKRGRGGEPGSASAPLSVASRIDGRWTRWAQYRVRNVLMASMSYLGIAASSTTNLEIDMSKPRLLLIHCSNGIRPGAKHRRRGRSFRPLVIHGGARARSAPRESSWEAAFEL